MTILDLTKAISNFGIGVVAVGALIWIVVYLVKHTVISMGVIISKLAENVNKLGDKIERHEAQQDMRGQFIKKEHEQLIKTGEEMVQAIGRINGFRKD